MDTISIAALITLKILCGFSELQEHPLGSNRHPVIDTMNVRAGVPVGSNYCASAISFALDSAQADFTRRTAVAQGFITKNSHTANDVLFNRYYPKAGDIVIWKLGQTWKGHVGLVIWWHNERGYTIEANTSKKGVANGRGSGIYEKHRSIDPTDYFRITHFTTVY